MAWLIKKTKTGTNLNVHKNGSRQIKVRTSLEYYATISKM